MLVVVDVRAADAGVVDGDEDVMGVGELGDGVLLEGDVPWLVEEEGEVLGLLVLCLVMLGSYVPTFLP